jgi:transposase
VVHLEQITSSALAPVVAAVGAAVRQAPVANLDETGWWEGQQRAWLWTAVTDLLTVCRLDPSRGKAVAQGLLGPDWRGIG